MSLWDWYVKPDNREALAPLLTFVGSLIVGVGTITVGALVARAALRQARTAIEQARTATEVAQIASRRHEEQTRADRARRITDTFSKAVEQLGSEKMEVRVGGIFTLERLSGEALASEEGEPADEVAPGPDLHRTVMETLAAFVRERAHWNEPKPATPEMTPNSGVRQIGAQSEGAQPPKPATDIAAVLAVIRRRPHAGREREKQRRWRFDLTETDLRGADLREAHLEGAYLSGVHLEGANLWEAHLEGADLRKAHLKGANLSQAHLEGAYLSGVHLEGANLWEAHLEDALSWEGASGDAKTRLPEGVERPADWPAFRLL